MDSMEKKIEVVEEVKASALPCGRDECVYRAIKEMVEKMKKEVVQRNPLQGANEGDIVVAKIYDIVASVLAKACRNHYKKRINKCLDTVNVRNVSMDVFILLRQLKDDKYITEEYYNILSDSLVKMKPEIKELVDMDRAGGIL